MFEPPQVQHIRNCSFSHQTRSSWPVELLEMFGWNPCHYVGNTRMIPLIFFNGLFQRVCEMVRALSTVCSCRTARNNDEDEGD